MRMRKEVFILSIDDILPNRFQPRIKFDEQAILELAESIKKHGVIQPIIVRKIADKYEIIAGERRYKASIMAGRKTIPAIITDVDDNESAEIALIENVQRKDMTPIEEAISYKKILDMGYLNQSDLALKIGKTQSTIANKLRLLNLTDEVQEALLEEKISERHARSLLKLNKSNQNEMLNKIISERLTVRKTDQAINELINKKEIKEEKGENMNNNINDNFNIPTGNIIETYSETNEINNENSNPNPGFMNIENIENNAKDINVSQNYFNPPFNPFGMPNQENIQQTQVEQSQSQPFNPFGMPNQENTQQTEVEQPQTQPFNPFGMPNQENTQQTEVEQPQTQPFNPFGMPNQENTQQIEIEQPQTQPFNPFGIPNQENTQQIEVEQPIQTINSYNLMDNNEFSTVSNSFNEQLNYSIPEVKELTPLMPEDNNIHQERIDFKTVINTIRDCVNKIESFGYKIDADELDFENSYKINITIEKN